MVPSIKSSILPVEEVLAGTTTPGQSGPGSNVNGELLYIT